MSQRVLVGKVEDKKALSCQTLAEPGVDVVEVSGRERVPLAAAGDEIGDLAVGLEHQREGVELDDVLQVARGSIGDLAEVEAGRDRTAELVEHVRLTSCGLLLREQAGVGERHRGGVADGSRRFELIGGEGA